MGKIVVGLELQTSEAVKATREMEKEIRKYTDKVRNLETAEKGYGKTIESRSKVMDTMTEKVRLQEKELGKLKKAQDEYLNAKSGSALNADELAMVKTLEKTYDRVHKNIQRDKAKIKGINGEIHQEQEKQAKEMGKAWDEAHKEDKKRSDAKLKEAQKQKEAELKAIEEIDKAHYQAQQEDKKRTDTKIKDVQKQKDAELKAVEDVDKAHYKALQDEESRQQKLHEQLVKNQSELKDLRWKMADDVLGMLDSISTKALATMTAAAVGLGVMFDESMTYESQMMEVTRVARGTDEQNALLKQTVEDAIWARPEDNAELLAAAEVLVKAVDPSNYSQIDEYLEDIANASLASNKALDEIASETMGLVEKGVLTLDDMDNYYSAMNETQNRFGTDMGMQSQILNSVGSQAMQNNITIPDMIALAGYVSKVTSRGAEASSSSLVELSNLFGSASYDTKGAEYVYDRMGSWDSVYKGKAGSIGSDKYKELAEMTMLSTSDLEKQLDTLAFRQDVADYTNRSVSDVLSMINNQETGTLFAEFFEGLRADAESEGILLSELVADKDYFSNNIRLKEMIADLSSADKGALSEYITVANDAYGEGTSVDKEADDILDSTRMRFDLWMKKFEQVRIEVGEFVGLGIMDLLEDLEPWMDKLLEFVQNFKGQDVEAQIKQSREFVDGFIQMFLIFGGLKAVSKLGKFVINARSSKKEFDRMRELTDLIAGTKGVAAGKGLQTLATGTTGLANTAGGAVGVIGKLQVGIAALASPIGLVVGSLALLAGGLYAHHQYQEWQAEQNIFKADTDGRLDKSQREEITNDLKDGRSARATTGLNKAYAMEVTYTPEELEGIKSSVGKQVTEINEQLDKQAGEFNFTVTGNVELDNKMAEKARQIREEATTNKTKTHTLEQELLGIYSDAIEQGGELTSKQIDEMNRLQNELDIMYAKTKGGDEEGSRLVMSAVQNQGGYELLTNKEAEDKSKELDEEVGRERTIMQQKLQEIDNMLKGDNPTITKEEAEILRKREIETFEGSMFRIMAEAAHLRDSRNFIDTFTYDDAFFNNSEYGMYNSYKDKMGTGMSELSDLQNIGSDLIVNQDSKELAESWVLFIEEFKNNKDSLDSFFKKGNTELFDAYTIQEGTEAMIELQGVIGGLIPEEQQNQLSAFVNLMVQAQNEAGELTNGEFQMYINNNFSELVTDAIEMGDLWEDTEFRDKFLNLDLDSHNASSKISNLLGQYNLVPDDVVTSIHEQGSSVVNSNIRQVKREMDQLNGKRSYVYVEYVMPKTKLNKNTLVGGNLNAIKNFAQLAEGTDSHKGGLAWLGDGGQNEPYLTPTGEFGVSPNDWTLYDLPRGTKVWPNINQFLSDIPKFANGTGQSWIDNKLKGGTGINNGESNSTVNYNVNIGAGAGVTKQEVERIIKKAHKDTYNRESSIKAIQGVR